MSMRPQMSTVSGFNLHLLEKLSRNLDRRSAPRLIVPKKKSSAVGRSDSWSISHATHETSITYLQL